MVPTSLVKGVVGAVLAWSWVLVALFMGDQLALAASTHGAGFATGSLQLCAFGGATAGFLVLNVAVRKASRGPEPAWRAAVAIAAAASALLLVAARAPVPGAVFLVALFACGFVAAYALRRSFALVESYAENVPAARCVSLVAALLCGSALLCAFASRMDALGVLALFAACLPASVALLPQGRLSIAPRSSDARAGLARLRSARAPHRAVLPCVVGALAVTLGFHTAVGDYLWAGGDPATVVYVAVLLGGALSALLAKRLSPRHLVDAAQTLLALGAVGLVPLLFVDFDPFSLSRNVCQNLLVLLAATLFAIVVTMVARGTFDVEARPTDGRTGLAAALLFSTGLVAGWGVGTLAARQVAADPTLFQAAVIAVVALLLAAVLALGGVRPGRTAGPEPDVRPDPGAAPSEGEGAPEGAVAPAVRPAADAAGDRPRVEPVEQRCNEVAWGYGLSQREHDILFLLAEGLTAQQVADRAFVSRNTVKSHMAHIYAKVGVHTRAELNDLLGVSGPDA